MRPKKILSALLIFVCTLAYTQDIKILNWGDVKVHITQDKTEKYLELSNGIYRNIVPYFVFEYEILSNDFEYELTNLKTSVVSSEEKNAVKKILSKLTESFIVEKSIRYDRGKVFAELAILPFRKEGSGYVKLEEFNVKIKGKDAEIRVRAKKVPYPENSSLSSGELFKIPIYHNGVYKLDYNYFNSLGINPASIQPNAVNVFGNGLGMIPEKNTSETPNDPLAVAIHFEGGEDGSFDVGDYILFYAQGPDSWKYDPFVKRFSHSKHLFSDRVYYYLGVNTGVEPNRIESIGQTGGVSNYETNSFDAYQFYEKEELNILNTGNLWLGEVFDYTTNHSIGGFDFPNVIKNEELKIRFSVVGHTLRSGTSTVYSKFNFTVNKDETKELNVAAVNGGIYGPGGNKKETVMYYIPKSDQLSIDITFDKYDAASKGWLDFVEINARRELIYNSGSLLIRDSKGFGTGNLVKYNVSKGKNATFYWETTDPINLKKFVPTVVGNDAYFQFEGDVIREFAVFSIGDAIVPEKGIAMANQNLHALSVADLLIVTAPEFRSQADQLAQFHREEGLVVHVVEPNLIYNEFGNGVMDITAIRSFGKMFYDRAGGDEALMPKYFLMFGDGSYDNLGRQDEKSFVPTFQSRESLEKDGSYTSDDYFGLFDEGESITRSDWIDIGIGRIPVSSVKQAQEAVNKILHYATSEECLGDWRNKVCLVADDEDNNSYNRSSEKLTDSIQKYAPEFNINKLYFDAFKQTSSAGGERYPDVNEKLRTQVEKGALVVNYIGHGGEAGWAHERVLDIPAIRGWENMNNMPAFVTATCEFSRYDNPDKFSAGEELFLNPKGGTIALFTTTRIVFSAPNEVINKNLYSYLFEKAQTGVVRMGDIIRHTKNRSSKTSGTNYRNFTLLGDPALRLAIPQLKIHLDSVNGKSTAIEHDTIRALEEITLQGHISNESGIFQANFNGVVNLNVYDKELILSTLGNDDSSFEEDFTLRKNIIYSGKATVKNGTFTAIFIAPRDISFSFGSARVSFYAQNGEIDAIGVSEDVIIGGSSILGVSDDEPPIVELYMNDESFVSGGITDERPTIFAKVSDDYGINTTGNGIGHDITAVLDADDKKTLNLNDFYEADVDTYKSGVIRYQLNNLEDGAHTLKLKVWDSNNNAGEAITEFIVAKSEEIVIQHLLNYPNPFTTSTRFMFEHNQVAQELNVQIQVYSISGSLVKTIQVSRQADQYQIGDIEWDGNDDFGTPLAKGVYIYRLTLQNEIGQEKDEIQKMVILK